MWRTNLVTPWNLDMTHPWPSLLPSLSHQGKHVWSNSRVSATRLFAEFTSSFKLFSRNQSSIDMYSLRHSKKLATLIPDRRSIISKSLWTASVWRRHNRRNMFPQCSVALTIVFFSALFLADPLRKSCSLFLLRSKWRVRWRFSIAVSSFFPSPTSPIVLQRESIMYLV